LVELLRAADPRACGFDTVIVCHAKNRLDIHETNRRLDRWLSVDYYTIGREYQYRDIERRIFAEQMLVPPEGGELKDYKIFCFNGEPRFVQADIDRNTNHTRNFYDLDWRRLPFTILYPGYDGNVDRPACLEEMLEVARKLSRPFEFVRIDLYAQGREVFFGEITFHHEGGFGPILPRSYARILGDYITLSSAAEDRAQCES